MTWIWKLLLFAGLAYGAILLVFYLAQTALIFPAHAVGRAVPLPEGAERLTLAAADGERLHGVHLPPSALPIQQQSLILGFAGNAWNAEDAAQYLAQILPQHDVVVFHYRGYAPSSGKPSAAALVADAAAVHDFVSSRFGARPIVAVGFSIGSGVAAHLAAVRRIAGAILVTPFDSLAAVGSGHYPWLPVGPLLRHRMEPAEELRGSAVPVAVIIAGADRLIPPLRGQALARAVPNLLFSRTIAAAGHNDIYQHPEFRIVMQTALAEMNARPQR